MLEKKTICQESDLNMINVINQRILSRAMIIIGFSTTYEEALKKAKASSLGYKHGDLGRIIDVLTRDYIVKEALNQSTNSIRKTDLEE